METNESLPETFDKGYTHQFQFERTHKTQKHEQKHPT